MGTGEYFVMGILRHSNTRAQLGRGDVQASDDCEMRLFESNPGPDRDTIVEFRWSSPPAGSLAALICFRFQVTRQGASSTRRQERLSPTHRLRSEGALRIERRTPPRGNINNIVTRGATLQVHVVTLLKTGLANRCECWQGC